MCQIPWCSLKLAVRHSDTYRSRHAPAPAFYVGCSAVAALITVVGVASHSLSHAPDVDRTVAVLQVCGAVTGAAWLLFAVRQSLMVYLGQTFDHRRAGGMGAALALAAPILWLAAALGRARLLDGRPGPALDQAAAIAGVQLVNSLLFVTFISMAVMRRETPDHHRRWMMLGMLVIAPAALLTPATPATQLLLGTALVDGALAVLCLRDRVRLSRLHQVYRIGAPILLFAQVASVALYVVRWPTVLAAITSLAAGRL